MQDLNNQSWHQMTKAAKKKLLKAAGYSQNYAYRTWDFVPRHIKNDVVYVFQRDKTKVENND